MLVFRDLRRTVRSARLIDALLRNLTEIRSATSSDTFDQALECALITAGELECGIHDSCLPVSDSQINDGSARLTDLLAQALISSDLNERRALAARAEESCKHL